MTQILFLTKELLGHSPDSFEQGEGLLPGLCLGGARCCPLSLQDYLDREMSLDFVENEKCCDSLFLIFQMSNFVTDARLMCFRSVETIRMLNMENMDMVTATIPIHGMLNREIAECLKERIQGISGVSFVETSHEDMSATVQFDQYTTDLDDIFLAIEKTGLDTK